jgi:hypothetical protein
MVYSNKIRKCQFGKQSNSSYVGWLTLVPIFLSATDGAKDTAEEFETVIRERRHLQPHPKSSST